MNETLLLAAKPMCLERRLFEAGGLIGIASLAGCRLRTRGVEFSDLAEKPARLLSFKGVPLEKIPKPPRPRLTGRELNATEAIFEGSADDWFHLHLFPSTARLPVVRHTPSGTGRWSFDSRSRAEGAFRPFVVTAGESLEFFLAGRLEESSQSAICRVELLWDGNKPDLSWSPVYLGSELGDVTALAWYPELEDRLALFDHPHARPTYLALEDGSIQVLAAPENYPALIGMAGMWTRLGLNADNTKVDTLTFYLQPTLVHLESQANP
ncbi:MAG: hypothetical protein ACE5H3_01625 [Planctomycetota bacterium]